MVILRKGPCDQLPHRWEHVCACFLCQKEANQLEGSAILTETLTRKAAPCRRVEPLLLQGPFVRRFGLCSCCLLGVPLTNKGGIPNSPKTSGTLLLNLPQTSPEPICRDPIAFSCWGKQHPKTAAPFSSWKSTGGRGSRIASMLLGCPPWPEAFPWGDWLSTRKQFPGNNSGHGPNHSLG